MDNTHLSDWETHEPGFRKDWETHYGSMGRTWNDYEPHYRYGHDLWMQDVYRDRHWDDIEPHVKKDWESRFKEGWEDFKDAVRHGWESLTGQHHHRKAA
jgi:broad specificity phosphatase PhoE